MFVSQALITKPRISGSNVMKEFLAYERDASIAFVKRAPEIPRIDKVGHVIGAIGENLTYIQVVICSYMLLNALLHDIKL